MRNYFSAPYGRIEEVGENYIIATYLVFGVSEQNALDKMGAFAVGQTVGTWVKVPGITDEMVDRYQAQIVGLYPVPDSDRYLLRLAFPAVNFCGNFVMMMTALVGNDVSTALRVKLLDLEFGSEALKGFAGPRKSMEDLRRLTNAYGRPVILNMIKPCLGFSPEQGAALFREVARGGVDIVKDDELLANTDYSSVEARVRCYNEAGRQIAAETGKQTVYMVNISDSPKKMRDNAKAAINAGAKACLVNFVFGGLDLLQEICEEFGKDLFIMAHYAGVGVLSHAGGGIANPVMIGLLPRLAGAHAVMTMFPPAGNPTLLHDFYATVQAQKLAMCSIGSTVTAVGGGVTPLNLGEVQQNLGNDIIFGVGGAIQGHPMGTASGAQAVMTAVQAAADGVSLEEAAQGCESLRSAVALWGKKKEETT